MPVTIPYPHPPISKTDPSAQFPPLFVILGILLEGAGSSLRAEVPFQQTEQSTWELPLFGVSLLSIVL